MRDELTLPHRSLHRSTAVAFYLVSSFLLLYPVLSTPVVADDLLNPFSQTAEGGSSLPAALEYSWRGATTGAGFRIVGGAVGSAFNWLWLTVSATFDVSLSTLYGLTKFVVLVICAASIARFWWIASREYGRGIEYWDALVLTSLALFGTLQIHALWSNDPVTSYPIAGYGSAALGFAVMSSAVLANRNETWRSYVVGAAVATVAVLYYEINIGAVIGAAVILSAGAWLQRSDRRKVALHLARSAIFVGVPAVMVLYGRTVTGPRSNTYSGTQVRTSGAIRAFLLGVGGVLPGAAWRLSIRALGGRVPLVFFVFGLVLFLAWMLRWWAQSYRHLVSESVGHSRFARAALVFATVGYGVFAITLQSITVKTQDETRELGYVYTFYAIGSSVIALGIAISIRSISLRWSGAALRYLLCVFALGFILVQSTVNWGLSEQLNRDYAVNRRLLDSFDQDVQQVERCNAFAAWAVVPWPAYYRAGMRNGLQAAYQYYFHEPFCASLPAPRG